MEVTPLSNPGRRLQQGGSAHGRLRTGGKNELGQHGVCKRHGALRVCLCSKGDKRPECRGHNLKRGKVCASEEKKPKRQPAGNTGMVPPPLEKKEWVLQTCLFGAGRRFQPHSKPQLDDGKARCAERIENKALLQKSTRGRCERGEERGKHKSVDQAKRHGTDSTFVSGKHGNRNFTARWALHTATYRSARPAVPWALSSARATSEVTVRRTRSSIVLASARWAKMGCRFEPPACPLKCAPGTCK